MMRLVKTSALIGAAVLLSGCGIEGTTAFGNGPIAIGSDRGLDSSSLTTLQAAIYVDPDGCHIWMIDDGFEGYWSRRRDPVSGLPVCTPIAPANSVVGEYDQGTVLRDRRPR